ncbi:MAG: hypothetical protein ABIG44_19625 [Planctomycetota bacterium]
MGVAEPLVGLSDLDQSGSAGDLCVVAPDNQVPIGDKTKVRLDE